MARKLPKNLTRSQRALLRAPPGGVRRVTEAEKLAHPSKFSPGGSYLIRAGAKVTARTPFITRSRKIDWLTGVSHGKAAKLRATGELRYGTAAAEVQAGKTKETRRLQREVKRITRAELPPTLPPSRRPRRRFYPVTSAMRDNFIGLRRRKLLGEYLDNGDWHQLVDIARAINDPALSALMKSP
jgi:hypothetical protein